jgi:hypothetical protein
MPSGGHQNIAAADAEGGTAFLDLTHDIEKGPVGPDSRA